MKNQSIGEIGFYDTFVVDTSVIINLHKSDCGKQIVQSLSGNVVVTQVVKSELDHMKSSIYGTGDFLNSILDLENVNLIELNAEEEELYDQLTDENNKLKIEDGEASVIAVCRKRFSGENCLAIIDDRKGRAVAEKILFGKAFGFSLDLFFHTEVMSNLGKVKTSNAVYFALLNARMSVPMECRQQVIELIGERRARKCISLPGFKNLF